METSLNVLMQFPNARLPATAAEKLVLGALAVGGVLLLAVFLWRARSDLQWLEQRKKPRGDRGRRLLDRMSAGWRPVYPGSVVLRGRDLREEDLADAFLADADLSDTDLRGVDFAGADLDGATLTNADLRGANLARANLTNVTLLRARYDEHTRWPSGFEPQRHGAIKVL